MDKCKTIIQTLFTSFSIYAITDNIYSILTIVLAILNIAWLLFLFIDKARERIKNKDIKGLADDTQQFMNGVQDVRDNIKKEGDK